MSGNPADIRCAEMNLSGFVLKYVDKGVVRPNHVSCGCMNHAFRFSCRAGSIKNKENIFRIHFCRWKKWISCLLHFLDFIRPPNITSFQHGDRYACALTNDDTFDGLIAN